MIPIGDANPTRRTPILTITLIIINVFAFFAELLSANLQQFFDIWAVIPIQIVNNFSAEFFTPFTAMFLHGGWSHLGGNMLYLWIFGDNLEDRLGKVRFLTYYLICGLIATVAQIVIEPSSPIPMIGASGAIAGVLGGYLMLYPNIRVRSIIPLLLFRTIQLPAIVVLGFWFVIQLFSGLSSLGAQTSGGGVAFFAHIGGFVAGFILVRLFGAKRQQHAYDVYRDRPSSNFY